MRTPIVLQTRIVTLRAQQEAFPIHPNSKFPFRSCHVMSAEARLRLNFKVYSIRSGNSPTSPDRPFLGGFRKMTDIKKMLHSYIYHHIYIK
jgi:hypothetical protein